MAFQIAKGLDSNSQNESYIFHLQQKGSQSVINLQHIKSSSSLPETSKIYQHSLFASLFYLGHVGEQGD